MPGLIHYEATVIRTYIAVLPDRPETEQKPRGRLQSAELASG